MSEDYTESSEGIVIPDANMPEGYDEACEQGQAAEAVLAAEEAYCIENGLESSDGLEAARRAVEEAYRRAEDIKNGVIIVKPAIDIVEVQSAPLTRVDNVVVNPSPFKAACIKKSAWKKEPTVDKPCDVQSLLAERKKTHGSFATHASVTQGLKRVFRAGLADAGNELTDEQIEAVEMIFHKLGRIAAGNPNYGDHMDDIIGYASLYMGREPE